MKDDKLKSFDKQESLKIIARLFNCPLHLNKSEYFKSLISKKLSAAGTTKLLLDIKDRIIPESIKVNKDPEDTIFGILYEWTQEFLDNKVYEERNRTHEVIFNDFFYEETKYIIAKLKKSENEIKELFTFNMDNVNQILREVPLTGITLERYRDNALCENEINAVIQIINKLIEIFAKETSPSLYIERAECYIKLKDYQKALEDVNMALFRLKVDTNYFLSASRILGTRVKIRRLLNDNIGEAADKKLIEEYENKVDRCPNTQERFRIGRENAQSILDSILPPVTPKTEEEIDD